VPGWEVPLSKFFDRRAWHSPPAMYAYDFGDDWQHVLVHEGFESADDDRSYPRCIAGEGPCPPEDCGGVHGYAELLQIMADPHHEDHEPTHRWHEGHRHPHAAWTRSCRKSSRTPSHNTFKSNEFQSRRV